MSDLLLRRRMLMSSAGLPMVKYGYLYNWYAGQGTGNASITSSDDWSLPLSSDLQTLSTYLGGNSVSGGKLKESAYVYWGNYGTEGTNQVNFNGRGADYRNIDGTFPLDWNTPSAHVYLEFLLKEPNKQVWLSAGSNAMTFFNTSFNTYGFSIRLFRAATVAEQLQADGSACAPYVGNDGLVYPTIKIGTQVWLGCNLAETKYRGGTDITNVTDNTQWASLTSGALCAYDNDINNVFI